MDTATCGLVALLAFYWQPDEKKKRASAITALVLAAVCPFTAIYAATILTEVPTIFMMMAMFVAVTKAFRKLTIEDTEESEHKNLRKSVRWWIVAGLIGGLNVLFRPDSGLFVAAVGLTLATTMIWRVVASAGLRETSVHIDSPLSRGERQREKELARVSPHPNLLPEGEVAVNPKRRRRFVLTARSKTIVARTLLFGSAFSLTFVLVLTPWTIRNWRVFHVFQPLAPAHGEMPGEFVPRGYLLWVRTWLDDESYIAPFLWSLDTDPLDIDDVPPYAFDSPDEKKRVATLFEAYNKESDEETTNPIQGAPRANASPTPQNDEPETEEGADEAENSSQQDRGAVEMTPEIDAAFGQLARERIARHRFQFYVLLPLKRARTMWFDTHSQYWPFEGTLLPLEDLDYSTHQQFWLPLFAGLTAVYTMLGLAGAWLLWVSKNLTAHRWLLLVVLAIVLRLILFSWIENPEPRYVVEFFPFLSAFGGIAIVEMLGRLKRGAVARP